VKLTTPVYCRGYERVELYSHSSMHLHDVQRGYEQGQLLPQQPLVRGPLIPDTTGANVRALAATSIYSNLSCDSAKQIDHNARTEPGRVGGMTYVDVTLFVLLPPPPVGACRRFNTSPSLYKLLQHSETTPSSTKQYSRIQFLLEPRREH
jgi:hypothetical protein